MNRTGIIDKIIEKEVSNEKENDIDTTRDCGQDGFEATKCQSLDVWKANSFLEKSDETFSGIGFAYRSNNRIITKQ